MQPDKGRGDDSLLPLGTVPVCPLSLWERVRVRASLRTGRVAVTSPGRSRGAGVLQRGLALAGLMVLSTGCYPGTYPIDIFPEMHYQPTQRRLEPARLSPAAGAVPVTGGRPQYTFAQAETLQNPAPRNAPNMDRARQLSKVNCSACHGSDGHGQGPVARYFVDARQEPPVDFSGPRARARTDGQLYWLITNGIGNMPPFSSLLNEDERWALVNFVREVQGQ